MKSSRPGLRHPHSDTYLGHIAPDERTDTGTGTEWQSNFTTAYQNHRHRLMSASVPTPPETGVKPGARATNTPPRP